MELQHTIKTNISIVSEVELLSYTHTLTPLREVLIRVDIGDAIKPIAGGGTYSANVYINNIVISPQSSVTVPSGVIKTIIVSKIIPLVRNDVVSLRITGLSADTSVNTVASVRDATPITIAEVTGPGAVLVNHNYGGTDALSYKTSGGSGIDNANIYVFIKTDYDSNNTGNAFIVAKTTTNVAGQWVSNLMLDPTVYTLVYFKQGYFGPDLKILTVS